MHRLTRRGPISLLMATAMFFACTTENNLRGGDAPDASDSHDLQQDEGPTDSNPEISVEGDSLVKDVTEHDCAPVCWVRHFSSSNFIPTSPVKHDRAGNVIIAGSYEETVHLNGTIFMEHATANDEEIFLAKFDSAGNSLWTRVFGLSAQGGVNSIAIDSEDSIIVTGFFQGSLGFGGPNLLYSNGNSDVFIAKFDRDGGHVWSRSFGSDGDDYSTGVATDGTDRIILAGYFSSGTIDFGGDEHLVSGEDDPGFLAKFDSDGTPLWSRAFTPIDDPGYVQIRLLTSDNSNNVLLAGTLMGTVNFGGSDLSTDKPSDRLFLVKFSSQGDHLWSMQTSVSADFESLVCGASDTILLTGSAMGPMVLGDAKLTDHEGGVSALLGHGRCRGHGVIRETGGSKMNQKEYLQKLPLMKLIREYVQVMQRVAQGDIPLLVYAARVEKVVEDRVTKMEALRTGFRCPICGSTSYHTFAVKASLLSNDLAAEDRDDRGHDREAQIHPDCLMEEAVEGVRAFLVCDGCSFMFREPRKASLACK